MANYIQLASVSEGIYYKMKVLSADWQDIGKQNATMQRTLGHTLSVTLGPSYMIYKGTAKIYTDDGAGFITPAKLYEWAGLTVIGSNWIPGTDINKRLLNLIDHDGIGPVPVILTSDVTPIYLEPTKTYRYYQFEFQQRA